jgi:ferredoxin-NADP reductase
MGGMMEGMAKMMEGMGAAAPKELYPSLMDLPELSPEKRAEVVQRAREQMETGRSLMFAAMERLSAAAERDDYAAMQEATTQAREATALFESGFAAHRALAEGKAPRNVALQWFKQDMNLLPAASTEPSHGLFGLAWFHYFVMFILIAFALAMVVMYFFKMRRAAALFGRLDPDANPPPPGSSPPLAGTPGPPAPPAEKSPPPDPPPEGASAVPVPGGDAANAADKPPAVSGANSQSQATLRSPVTANWRGQLRVGSIVTETPSVKTFRLLPSSNGGFLPFTFVPGQFLNVAFWIGGAKMNRSYSISSSPAQREYVELTVRREPRGAVSRHIDDLLKVGDLIEASGPVGKFTFNGTEADSIVLIGGGVGITPMMSITRYLTERSWPGDIFFIYTCRTPADFIFADEVAALERRNPKLHVAVTISKAEGTDWKGARGRITKEWLTQTVPELASRRIHICGPPAMMDSTKAMLAELGVPADQMKTEAFGAVKPTPAPAGTTAKPTAPATGPLVTFSKNNKSAKIRLDLQTGDSPPKQSILELSEELGIGIEFSCRVGTCGICKVKMTSGEVEMEVEDALDADDKTNGIILACQAKPKGDVTVEA